MKTHLSPQVLLSVLALASSEAATVSFSGAVVSQMTNFTTNVSLPQFDPSQGTLTGVQFLLEGTVNGTISYESLDSVSSTLNATASATIEVAGPGALNGQANAADVELRSITAFDGAIDFGGTSGGTFNGLSGISPEESLNPASLAPYIGNGMESFTITATGTSSIVGAGNIASIIETNAGANYEIVYTFTPVPEPASSLLIGIGTLALLHRRRRS